MMNLFGSLFIQFAVWSKPYYIRRSVNGKPMVSKTMTVGSNPTRLANIKEVDKNGNGY